MNGVDITKASRAERFAIRRSTVSFIFQSFNLFPGLTALENVQFGAEWRGARPPPTSRPICWRASGSAPGSATSPPAVRGRATAGGDRAGDGHRQPDPARRRTDGPTRLPTGVQILELL